MPIFKYFIVEPPSPQYPYSDDQVPYRLSVTFDRGLCEYASLVQVRWTETPTYFIMKTPTIFLTFLANCYFIFCEDNISKLFDKINSNFVHYNSIAASITWESSVNPINTDLIVKTANYQKKWVVWQQTTCAQLAAMEKRHLLNETQRRQTYLLCRGPQYSYREARLLTSLYDELQSLYSNNEICIPVNKNVSKDNVKETESATLNYLSTVNQLWKIQNGATFAAKMAAKSSLSEGLCFAGEEEFGRLMKNVGNEEVLKWLWLVWREKIGEPMRDPYRQLVDLENRAAWRKGYSDIGESWRDELEVPDLRQKCRQLYSSIKPLYTLLHGVVRFYLRRQYGEVVPEFGPIPAHLLGNLWAQNWEKMADLIPSKKINLDDNIQKLNWTVHHMVKRVEDFYQSLGMPQMTDNFWRESIFEKKDGDTRCHGTAADMFKDGDFRLLYCSGMTMEDFYVLHHEFGHIHYYMAYEKQPGLFRQANAAFHESIGDAIMLGVMTPQHLHRLGLVNDSILYVNSSGNFKIRSDPEIIHNLFDDERTEVASTDLSKHGEHTRDTIQIREGKVFENRFDLRITDNLGPNDRKTKEETGVYDGYLRKTKQHREVEIEVPKTKVNVFPNQANVEKTNEREKVSSNHKVGDFKTEDFQVDNNLTTDEILLLKLALNKIPQIPFALVIDEYRWKYFEGSIDKDKLNKEFWDLSLELQGITPPVDRSEEYFDVGAKFHVPDNTPFIRYFLSSFIQHQIFEALCRAAVFGRRDMNAKIPDTIPLNRCDIYGSKAAGKLLKDFLSRGHSQHWQEILLSTTGNTDISAAALERYYRPLYNVLARIVRKNKIPLGW